MTNEERLRSANFPEARALIYQRAFGTLAHELGNVTSPLALIADVLDAGRTHQMSTSAGTLRLIATALARTTTICRFLRGSSDPASLSPSTIGDTAAWWLLCAPFAEEMLPATAAVRATMAPAALAAPGYEALTWATIALVRWTADSRLAFQALTVVGAVGARGGTFDLQLRAEAPRRSSILPATRQLRRLASWELRRAGGRVQVAEREDAVVSRMSLPLARPTPMVIVS